MSASDLPPGSQEFPQPQRRVHDRHLAYQGFVDTSARFNLISAHDALVASAEHWIQQREYNVAVVFLETACEVAAERLIDSLLEQRKAGWVKEARLLRDYAITDGRVRRVYEVLTGDRSIAQTSFWSDLQASSVVRNRVIHGHYQATKEEAEKGLQSVRDLLTHLRATAGSLGITGF